MIFYFSATGNSEYIASRLACATGEKMLSMSWCLDQKKLYYTIPKGERIGIITPTYFWGIPSTVKVFMKYIRFSYEEKPYIYFVTTYGNSSGHSCYFTERCLKKHNHTRFDASYSMKMPHTWTPIYNMKDSEGLDHILSDALMQMDRLIDRVVCRDKGDFMQDKSTILTRSLYRSTYERMRETRHLHLEDNCNGCGFCAQICPTHAIEIREGKAVWIKDRCAMCLACLHRCPDFSVQYGKHTKRHGQYYNPLLSNNIEKKD